jgi:capsular polysaccharide biosynthesis protein
MSFRLTDKLAGGRRRLTPIERMDDVRGVALVDVDLPREPAAPPTSRTVQPDMHPNFVRSYAAPPHQLRVAIVPDGRVMGSGAVVTTQGELVEESLWDIDHFRRHFNPPKAYPKAVRIEGRCASLISLWCDNYFHWIFNSLPRLAVLNASGVAYDRLLVPAELKPFQRETLALLGVHEEQLVPYAGEHVQADELVWAAPLAPINEPSSFLLEWVKSSLCPLDEEPSRLLYVSREGGTRRAVNEAAIFGALKPLGFEFVLPEHLSFTEQVRLFAQARVAVGPHGSNFVNAIFSRHMSVVEFFQPAHVNWGVYSVLCAAGQDHWNLLCDPVPRRRLGVRRFDDMQVPVDLVLETIRRIDVERH